jgi:thioredoxin reductase
VKRVLLCDAGPRRNAAAEHMHGFVSREAIPPLEFRRIAREQLRPYDVTVTEVGVQDLVPQAGGFMVTLADGTPVTCRRALLAAGMIDEIPPIPGMDELWGHSVFLCPYCHGWEVRDRRWGMLATSEAQLAFAIFLTGWTGDVVAFTNGPIEIPGELRGRLERAGVAVDSRRIRRLLVGPDRRLDGVEMEDGGVVGRDALVVRPPQHQIPLVQQLRLDLDEAGFVRVDDQAETSVRGIHAAGDLTTAMQAAVLAAAAGTAAAYRMNHALNMERFA